MKKSLILLGFPGVGKSTLTQSYPAHDSDSSSFSWSSPGIRHPNFPTNYIEHLKTLDGLVLASSHDTVRRTLRDSGVPYGLAHPTYGCKEEYIERYKARGSDAAFVKLLNRNWEAWLSELFHDHACQLRIVLKPGEYLADHLDHIKAILTEKWVPVKLSEVGVASAPNGSAVRSVPIHPDAVKCAQQYVERNCSMGAEYGQLPTPNPMVGIPMRTFVIYENNVCCRLKDLEIKKDAAGRSFIWGKALPTGPRAQELYAKFKRDPNALNFAARGIVEKGVTTHILSWDYVGHEA